MHSVNTRIMHFIEFMNMLCMCNVCLLVFSKLLTAWTDNVFCVCVCMCERERDNVVEANVGWLDRWVAGN